MLTSILIKLMLTMVISKTNVMHFKNLLLSLSLLLTSLVPLYFIDNDEPKLLFLLISQIRYSHCKIIWSLSQISPFHIFFSNPSFSFLLDLKSTCQNSQTHFTFSSRINHNILFSGRQRLGGGSTSNGGDVMEFV